MRDTLSNEEYVVIDQQGYICIVRKINFILHRNVLQNKTKKNEMTRTLKVVIIQKKNEMKNNFSCSTDINIFSHPHYDTYHDIARVHWHAFKVPDINQLTIKCSIEICTDIPDTISGLTSCDSIPSVRYFNLQN